MTPLNSHVEFITSLSFLLGGLENILQIENCMSRLRIQTKNPSLTEDKDFLNLGVSGVVRTEHELHLIVGTEAINISKKFQNLITTSTDHTTIYILSHLGGAPNISKIETINNDIGIQLHNPVPIPTVPQLTFTKTSSGFHLSSNDIPLQTLYSHLKTGILFWTFLYAFCIFRIFEKNNIQEIKACRMRLSLKLKSTKNLPSNYSLLGHNTLLVNEEDFQVQIPCPSHAEQYEYFLKQFLK